MNERGELYGSARLLSVLRELNQPAAILQAVRDDVRAFAGDELERARFFPEDDRYLVERDLHVTHHLVDLNVPSQ